MAKRKAKPPLSETYAARVARGRIPRSISLSAEASAILDEISERRGETRSATVEAAIVALAERG